LAKRRAREPQTLGALAPETLDRLRSVVPYEKGLRALEIFLPAAYAAHAPKVTNPAYSRNTH
jgi:hypothetical protein